MYCPQCGLGQPSTHRFCVACGTALPADLLGRPGPKVSRWFLGIPVGPDDPPNAALRVSRYLEEVEVRAREGSVRVPAHHVRFSVWEEDRAVAAVSIPDHEAEELARFLLAWVPARDADEPAPADRGTSLGQTTSPGDGAGGSGGARTAPR